MVNYHYSFDSGHPVHFYFEDSSMGKEQKNNILIMSMSQKVKMITTFFLKAIPNVTFFVLAALFLVS